tara:strand:+ start:489 stop:1361 length:873 start_codon:yes stop_codon:yes gene_type:complete
MMTQKITCRLCGCADSTFLFLKNKFPLYKCNNCSFIFSSFPNISLVDDLYSADYYMNDITGGYGDYILERRAIEQTSRGRLSNIKSYIDYSCKLLDIGSAFGYFLNQAKSFYQVSGVEPSLFAAKYAQNKFGLNIINGTIHETPFKKSSFGIVTMWDVLEHLFNPLQVLNKVNNILRPKGLLVLSTPDVSSIAARIQGNNWRLFDPPYHLNYFSPHTIKVLLCDAGFKVIKREYTFEWHTVKYFFHVLAINNNNAFFKRMNNLFRRNILRDWFFPATLFDIMTIYAVKES